MKSGTQIDVASEQVLIDDISSVDGNHRSGDLDFCHARTGERSGMDVDLGA